MSEWTECTLGDVVTLQRGYDLPSRVRRQGCYPVLSSSGTTDWHAEYKVEGPGVVTGRYGTIGEVFYVAGKYWPLNTTLFVSDFKGNVPRFVYYLLKLFDFKKFSDKSAVPGVNRNDLYPTKIRLPRDRETQESIALVLHSLNDKIEHNNKLIKMLEEQVQLLYDYWFMQFDFPDENGKPYRSSGGKMVWNDKLKRDIPESWHVDNIYACCDLLNGLACQKYPHHPGKQSMPVIKIREMHEGFNEKSDHVHVAVPAKYIVNNGDILFSWSATLEVMIWCGGQGCLNQHIFKVQPRLESWTYVYMLLKQTVTHFARIAESRKTTMGHITSDHLKETKVLIPHKDVLEAFESAVASLIERIVSTSVQNRVLSEQRDFLLPLLMSGQVTVVE